MALRMPSWPHFPSVYFSAASAPLPNPPVPTPPGWSPGWSAGPRSFPSGAPPPSPLEQRPVLIGPRGHQQEPHGSSAKSKVNWSVWAAPKWLGSLALPNDSEEVMRFPGLPGALRSPALKATAKHPSDT